MGDASFWQDAADLVGPRPPAGLAWATYLPRRLALQGLALVAAVAQVCGFAGCSEVQDPAFSSNARKTVAVS
jgi:hypothetical protein